MIYLIDPQECQIRPCKTLCWAKPLYGVPLCAEIW